MKYKCPECYEIITLDEKPVMVICPKCLTVIKDINKKEDDD